MVKMERKQISSWNGFLVSVLHGSIRSKTIPIYYATNEKYGPQFENCKYIYW